MNIRQLQFQEKKWANFTSLLLLILNFVSIMPWIAELVGCCLLKESIYAGLTWAAARINSEFCPYKVLTDIYCIFLLHFIYLTSYLISAIYEINYIIYLTIERGLGLLVVVWVAATLSLSLYIYIYMVCKIKEVIYRTSCCIYE